MNNGFKIVLNGSGTVNDSNNSSVIINNIDAVSISLPCDICNLCESKNIPECKLANWFMEHDLNTFFQSTALLNPSKSFYIEYNLTKPETAIINLTFQGGHNSIKASTQVGIWFGYAVSQHNVRKK